MMIKKHPSIPPLHPGSILREDILPALAMSKTEVAKSLGISRTMLYAIMGEKKPITAEMAVRFGRFFGNGPDVWLNLQRIYDLEMAQKKIDVSAIPTIQQSKSYAA